MTRSVGIRRLFTRTSFLTTAVLAVLLMSSVTSAKEYDPFIMYVFPAGGQRGTTVEIIARGRGLEGTSQALISGESVTAKVLAIEKPSTRLAQRSANRQDQAENPNVVRMAVTIAPDARLGIRDIRLVTPKGATNRFRFAVGQVPEVKEMDRQSGVTEPQKLDAIPVLVNGQVFQGDRDFYQFQAKAGQTLVCEVQGRKLLPYIADAVPGWLQASLTLYDANGKELAYSDDYRFHPDPLIVFHVPTDGAYQLEVKDVLFRGREDLVYRLSIGALPYLTHIFPLGGQRDKPTRVELHGVNLPKNEFTLAVPGDAPPKLDVGDLQHQGLFSNRLPFAVGDLAEVTETEPNNSIEEAGKVEVPVTINGRIQQSGDEDYFSFNIPKRQYLLVELFGRRLESPIDSFVTVMNAKGQDLVENDDYVDPANQYITHHADSRLGYDFRAPGDYLVRVRDVENRGGDEFAYRLTISPPRHDYGVRIVGDHPRVGQGSNGLMTVEALRKDGFNAEIQLSVQGLPAGFVVSPATIPAGQNQVRFTVTAPRDAKLGVVKPAIHATAAVANQQVSRVAQPAERVMQAFIYYHTLPTDDCLLSVTPPPVFTLSMASLPSQIIEIPQGATANVVLKADRIGMDAYVRKAQAEKKVADDALAEVRQELAAAKTAYDAAQKAARTAESAAARAKSAASRAASTQATTQKTAAAKRQQANVAKKKLEDLTAQRLKPAEAQLADATQALTDAQKAKAAADKLADLQAKKKAAEQAVANVGKQIDAAMKALQSADQAAKTAEMAANKAKAAADAARANQAATAEDAIEKRKLANEAKVRRDKLTNDEKAANTHAAEAKKKTDVASALVKGTITLLAATPPRNVTVKRATIAADKNEATVSITVAKAVPAGFAQNLIINGSLKAGAETFTAVAPAIPIRVIAPPKK